MKKLLILFLIVALTGTFSLITACAKPPAAEETTAETKAEETAATTATEAPAKRPLIGFILPSKLVPRWERDEAAFVAKANELGADVIVQYSNDDEKLQASQVESMLTQNIDVLALTAINANTAASLVKMAKDEGVPVVGYARIILNADVDVQILRRDIDVGEIAAKMALEFAPKGNYVIVSGDEGDQVSHIKTEGYHNILDPFVDKGDIKIVSEQFNRGWDPQSSLEQVENALTANNNDIQVILSNNDGMAMGALQAVEAEGLTGKIFISGEDVDLPNAQAIVEGKITMSAFSDIVAWGQGGAEAAYDLAVGNTPKYDIVVNNGFKDVLTVEIGIIGVTKDNMYDVIVKPGFHKLEDVYANVPKDQWPKE